MTSSHVITFFSSDLPRITKQPVNSVTTESDSAHFECEADGFPKPEIRWVKLNSRLPSRRASVQPNGTLSIRHANKDDAGTYACVAANVFGVVKSYVALVVQGRA